jgi:hypothetical protein
MRRREQAAGGMRRVARISYREADGSDEITHILDAVVHRYATARTGPLRL